MIRRATRDGREARGNEEREKREVSERERGDREKRKRQKDNLKRGGGGAKRPPSPLFIEFSRSDPAI